MSRDGMTGTTVPKARGIRGAGGKDGVLSRAAPLIFVFVAALSAWIMLRSPEYLAVTWLVLMGAFVLGLRFVRASVAESVAAISVLACVIGVALWADYLRPAATGASLYRTLLEARILMVGWALVLWIPVRADMRHAQGNELPNWTGPAVLALGIVVVILCHLQLTAVGHTGFVDEILYVFHSRQYANGRLEAPLPDELHQFFVLVNTVSRNHAMHTQYTPGWPFLLAVLTKVGLFGAPWLFAVLTMIGIYIIGRRLGGPSVAVFAVLALVLNAIYLRWSAGYLSHSGTTCCLVWMAVLMLKAESRSGWAQWALFAAAGVVGGIAFTARPLTALALGVAVWLWLGLRSQRSVTGWIAMTAAIVVGALLPLAAFLWVNALTNGSPLKLGYGMAHAGGHSPGFSGGSRIRYDAIGIPHRVELDVTPLAALSRSVRNWFIVIRSGLPAGMLMALAWSSWRAGLKLRAGSLAFLLFPAAFFFWPTAPIRTVTEGLPFLALGLGFGMAALWKWNVSWTRWALAALAVAAVLQIPRDIHTAGVRARTMEPYVERVRSLSENRPIVVFVNRGNLAEDGLFEGLWWFNALDWMGNIVVARDLGVRNSVLQSHFPGRNAYLVTGRSGVRVPSDVAVATLCPSDWTRTCSRAPSD